MGEWLNLTLRWLHIIAGVFWLGQTALFTWLDARLRAMAREGQGQVWMVHSGGFYVVERQSKPAAAGQKLHWFKWEAAITWATGFALLVQLYWLGGALVDPYEGLGERAAIALSAAVLVLGWVLYDLLWISPLRHHERLGGALCFLAVVALGWGLVQVFSGRGAYLQVGALFGTIMAANVWVRILPPQRRMVAALVAGRPPDPNDEAMPKQRSKHNTFLAIPLLFIMVSHHFPLATYGHAWNWLILAGLTLAGFALRWSINWHEQR
jgi:uncharacterized membrane protein